MDANTFLVLAGGIILAGVLGEYAFRKTGIPDILVLIIIGLALGPAFHVVEPSGLVAMAPFVAPIALIILLFDAGLGMNVFKLVQRSPRASLLSVLNIGLSIAACAVFMPLVAGWGYVEGALLGAIIGGTSSPIVIQFIKGLKPSEEAGDMLILESIVTDVLCIVLGIALIDVALAGVAPSMFSEVVKDIFAAFSVGAVLGLLGGTVWVGVIRGFRVSAVAHLLTVAMLFLLYVFTEAVGGSGALSALFFGLVLGNSKDIAVALRLKNQEPIDEWTMKLFQTELSFFVRTFFFVFLGAIVIVQRVDYMVIGLGLSAILLGMRYVTAFVSTIGSALSRERLLIGIMAPRGLAAAVLAQLPLAYGVAHGADYVEIVFMVIIATVVITAMNVAFWRKRITGGTEPTPTRAEEKPARPRKG